MEFKFDVGPVLLKFVVVNGGPLQRGTQVARFHRLEYSIHFEEMSFLVDNRVYTRFVDETITDIEHVLAVQVTGDYLVDCVEVKVNVPVRL
ncbi:hypothetical protein HanIR_Chr11g0506061 [Helianthus annuus]|nr:hypothetical protein HanIR_Chr11g0506061 [Helianthus annuus]